MTRRFRSTGTLTVLALATISAHIATAQSWTQLAPTGGPPSARLLPTGVYDPATNQMIIFGGSAFSVDTNDLWALTLGGSPTWTLLSPAGTPPAPRVGHEAVYDSANTRMILFGGGLGATSPCANDVWVLSNANSVGGTPTWTQLGPSGPAPAGRYVSSAVYDAASNRMTVFGGNDCFSGFYNDVWVLSNANGLGGTPAWTQLTPAGTPPSPSGYQSAVYDPGSNRMILFGVVSAGSFSNQVWVLTSANGLGGTPTWIQLAPAGTPIPARTEQAAVYDVLSNRMTVFGGGATSTLNEVWVLSNANGLGGTPTWVQLAPSGALPAPRAGLPAVYDPATNRMVIFAGQKSGYPLTYYNDAWVLTNANGEHFYSICPLYDPTKAVHSGATIPIKLQLCDGSGNDLSSSSITVHAVSIIQVSNSISGAVEDSGNANPDYDFRFDATLGSTGGYIFNLKTTGLSTGTYSLNFTVTGDSFVYPTSFEVK